MNSRDRAKIADALEAAAAYFEDKADITATDHPNTEMKLAQDINEAIGCFERTSKEDDLESWWATAAAALIGRLRGDTSLMLAASRAALNKTDAVEYGSGLANRILRPRTTLETVKIGGTK